MANIVSYYTIYEKNSTKHQHEHYKCLCQIKSPNELKCNYCIGDLFTFRKSL